MTMEETSSKSFTVMIVDGQEIFRQGLRTLLDEIGGFHVVAEVNNSRDMLEQLRANASDLVLLDASLPDTSNREVILRLREVAPTSAFIIFSDVIVGELLLQSILLGAGGFLTKDLPKLAVITALRNWQQGALALTPPIATFLVQCLVSKYKGLERVIGEFTETNTQKTTQSFALTAHSMEVQPSAPNFSNSAVLKLTHQEQRVFLLMHQGLSNKQIAAHLAISPYTVGKHVQQILRKLGVSNRTQAASFTSIKGGISAVDELY